jgi:hypothetical protein
MTAMRVNELEFGSLLTYTPRGNSPSADHAHEFMIALKTERFVEDSNGKPVPMSEWVAETIQRNMTTLPFAPFFQPNTILVPTPKSSLMKPDTLWVPERIASALAKIGLGERVQSCLTRVRPVPKAATSLPSNRPTPLDHYNSLRVVGTIFQPQEIVLIDDIITRGATLLGAANRLVDAFPETQIRALVAMRTISNPDKFKELFDPCVGIIELQNNGETLRRP